MCYYVSMDTQGAYCALFLFQNEVVSVANVLTARQQRFVEEYLVDNNATQAAIRAGYSEKTAKQIGSRILTNVDIAAEIQARRAVVSEKLEITQERVLQELAAIGFADVSDYVTVTTEQARGIDPITGEMALLPIDQRQYVRVIDTMALSKQKRAALAGIKQGSNGIEIKLHDKQRALELLGKYLGLFDNREAPPPVDNNLFDMIVDSAQEGLCTDDLPEIEQAATAGADVVEPPGVQAP